jgi:hypothetical protein
VDERAAACILAVRPSLPSAVVFALGRSGLGATAARHLHPEPAGESTVRSVLTNHVLLDDPELRAGAVDERRAPEARILAIGDHGDPAA